MLKSRRCVTIPGKLMHVSTSRLTALCKCASVRHACEGRAERRVFEARLSSAQEDGRYRQNRAKKRRRAEQRGLV
eukprot:6179115-Pleurochrysis_carterae.AAC.1